MHAEWVRLGVGVGALALIAIGALSWAGAPRRATVMAVVTAVLRAAIQLGVVALALHGVFRAPAAAFAVLAVMLAVAVWTASRRLVDLPGATSAVLLSSVLGAGVSVGLIVGLPVLQRDARYLVAVAGIVIGGTMTACTLTGRRLVQGIRERRDEVEGWLALGATPRQAVRDVARAAVHEAMIPALDQTRTVGLVTLPGAFVGALVGGASTADAARFQVVVLAGLLCAEALAAAALAYRLGAPTQLPI